MNGFTTLFLSFALLMITCTHSSGGLIKDKESWVQEIWCKAQNGKLEHILKDGSRVDCLTPTHAIETELAREWHEAVGQSLFYAQETKKQAGIVLVLRSKEDFIYLKSLNKLVATYKLPITVWHIGPYLKE